MCQYEKRKCRYRKHTLIFNGIQFITIFSFAIIFIVGNTVNTCVHSLYTVTVAYNHVAYMQRYSESHSINRRMYLCTCRLHRKYAVERHLKMPNKFNRKILYTPEFPENVTLKPSNCGIQHFSYGILMHL